MPATATGRDMILRPYQHDIIAAFDAEIERGIRRVILVAPTGSGKTIILADIVRKLARSNKRVMVLAHRREIIAQTGDKLRAAGVVHGIIQAGFRPRPLELVQVASVQTLWVRAKHADAEAMTFPPADLLVIDECHHCPARTYRQIIAAYPDAIVLGLTATPCRGDGRGLGSIFEVLIECPQVPDLISQGWLVPTRVYAPVTPDLKGVHTLKLAEEFTFPVASGVVAGGSLMGVVLVLWANGAAFSASSSAIGETGTALLTPLFAAGRRMQADVRFTPESGHGSVHPECPLSAKS